MKKAKRREFIVEGTAAYEFTINVMARTKTEAEDFAQQILNSMKVPKSVLVQVGNGYSRLIEFVDFFLDDTSTTTIGDLATDDYLEDHQKCLD